MLANEGTAVVAHLSHQFSEGFQDQDVSLNTAMCTATRGILHIATPLFLGQVRQYTRDPE